MKRENKERYHLVVSRFVLGLLMPLLLIVGLLFVTMPESHAAWGDPYFNFYKIDGRTGKDLSGAVFRVTKGDASYETESDTWMEEDRERTHYVTPQIERGLYRVEEIQAPEGYVGLQKPFEHELDNGIPTYYVVNMHKEDAVGKVVVTKEDEDSGEKLPGASFLLEGASYSGEAISMTGTTGPDGSYTFENVPIGTYTVTETSPPKDYELGSTLSKEVEVGVEQRIHRYVYEAVIECEQYEKDGKVYTRATLSMPDAPDLGLKYYEGYHASIVYVPKSGNGLRGPTLWEGDIMDLLGVEDMVLFDSADTTTYPPYQNGFFGIATWYTPEGVTYKNDLTHFYVGWDEGSNYSAGDGIVKGTGVGTFETRPYVEESVVDAEVVFQNPKSEPPAPSDEELPEDGDASPSGNDEDANSPSDVAAPGSTRASEKSVQTGDHSMPILAALALGLSLAVLIRRRKNAA